MEEMAKLRDVFEMRIGEWTSELVGYTCHSGLG